MSKIEVAVNGWIGEMYRKLARTKQLGDADEVMQTQLKRCLSTFDIILLGIGHMVGSGIYVLTSAVARNIAGPAIVLSYIISGFASFLSALCYSEFAGRFPRAGSAYSYTYLATGEIWAFIVGWNMVLENVIGTAAVSRACSAYVDSLLGGVIKNKTLTLISSYSELNSITQHTDIFACLIVVAFMIFLTCGVRVTTYLNNIFSMVNIGVIFIILTVGAYFSDFSNWRSNFMPFGWKGVFQGSATCFYAYVGFDSIATSGEEAKTPRRSIPIATITSMTFATIAYVGVSSVLTLMVPYDQISAESGLPDALGSHGADWAKFVVIGGACCGMITVLIGTLYSLTRIVYAMADDGLLFSWMAVVESRTQIPLLAMYFFASIGAILALFLDITTLIEMMSIGTLIAYLVVSASLIIIRYQSPNGLHHSLSNESPHAELNNLSARSSLSDGKQLMDELVVGSDEPKPSFSHYLRAYVSRHMSEYLSDSMVSICVIVIVILIFGICLTVPTVIQDSLNVSGMVLIGVLVLLSMVAFIIISLHEQNVSSIEYKVPLVPFIPLLSILFNVALIINLQSLTWLRLLIWMTIGFIIYFSYGIKHSKLDPNSNLIQSGGTRNWGSLEDSACLADTVSNASNY